MKLIKFNHHGKNVVGKLTTFPKKSIIVGVNRHNNKTKSFNSYNNINLRLDTIDDYIGLRLCHYKHFWWIYYDNIKGNNHKGMTGSFDSRKKAIEWFEFAGR